MATAQAPAACTSKNGSVPEQETGPVYSQKPILIYSRDTWDSEWVLAESASLISATNCTAPQMPVARIRQYYGEIIPEGQLEYKTILPEDFLSKYVQIRIGTEDGTDETPVWTGVVTSFDDHPDGVLENDSEAVASGYREFSCHGLAHLFDRIKIRKSVCKINTFYREIGRAITFNKRTPYGVLTGNRHTSKYSYFGREESYIFSDNGSVHPFDEISISDGDVWTNSNIIEYLFANIAYDLEFDKYEIQGNVDALDLISDIYSFENRSVWEALCELMPRQRGMTFSIYPGGDDGNTIIIRVNTIFGEDVSCGDITFPASTQKGEINLYKYDYIQDPVIRTIDSEMYGTVIVRGDPIRVCYTISAKDTTLIKKWTTSEECEYRASTTERRKTNLRHVFSRFRTPTAYCTDNPSPGPVTRGGDHGASKSVVYSCENDGTITVDSYAGLFRDGRTFDPVLPIIENTSSETELIAPKSASEGGPIRVFARLGNYDTETASTEKIVRLGNEDETLGLPAFTIRVLDDDMGIEVLGHPESHVLALDQYVPVSDDESQTEQLINWESLVATVSVTTDERLHVTETIDEELKRELIIDIPGAAAWIVADDTVLATDGSTFQKSSETILRDDSDKLRAIAAAAKAWYQKKRRAIKAKAIGLHFIDVGALITNIYDGAAPDLVHDTEANTVITAVTWSPGNNGAGETEFETDFWDLDFAQYSGMNTRKMMLVKDDIYQKLDALAMQASGNKTTNMQSRRYVQQVKNEYSGTIPIYGCVEVTGKDDGGRWTVTRPTADNLPAGRLMFTTCEIEAGKTGGAVSAFDHDAIGLTETYLGIGYGGSIEDSFYINTETGTGFCVINAGWHLGIYLRPM